MTDIFSEAGYVVLLIFSVPLIYWFIGLRTSWRNTFACVFLTYAAAILACQYADRLARSSWLNGEVFRSANIAQASALAFGLLLLGALLALAIVFQLMWGRGSGVESEAGSRLLRSLVTAGAGWGLAALLLLSLVGFLAEKPVWRVLDTMSGGFVDAIEVTSRAVISLVTPWLTSGLPLFMGG